MAGRCKGQITCKDGGTQEVRACIGLIILDGSFAMWQWCREVLDVETQIR